MPRRPDRPLRGASVRASMRAPVRASVRALMRALVRASCRAAEAAYSCRTQPWIRVGGTVPDATMASGPYPDDVLRQAMRRLFRLSSLLEPHDHGGLQVTASEVFALGEL